MIILVPRGRGDQLIQQNNNCSVLLRYKQCNALMHSFNFGSSGGEVLVGLRQMFARVAFNYYGAKIRERKVIGVMNALLVPI